LISTTVGDLSSFAAILQARCRETPEALAFTYSAGGGQQRQTLTYAHLDLRARTIAAWLQHQGFSGERVLLVYPHSLDFIAALFGCLYAGAVPCPAYPPHPAQVARTVPRLLAIVDDARPAVALAPSEFLRTAQQVTTSHEQTLDIHWSQLPEGSNDLADRWKPPSVHPTDLALLQYTSGSTDIPKGVMITHENLLHNSRQIQRAFNLGRIRCGVSWLPPFHDMGLIGSVFQPIYSGFQAHLMSPLAFLQRPLRWLQAISELRAEISGGPNFAYDHCVRRISAEDMKSLDLSCWKIAFNGSEPVQWGTLERFAEAFQECGFRSEAFVPCYGLAEATLMVSAGTPSMSPRVLSLKRTSLEANRVDPADKSDLGDVLRVAACGRPGDGVAVVSPESLTGCPEYQVGEIWVRGSSVAKGYWNRPDETQQVFNAYRADTGEGPFLRTGDLGFKAEGELFLTGRLKDLIIIAGRNHYPNDIEITVERSHSLIRSGCCAAFSVIVDEEERLVIAAELDRRQGDREAGGEVERCITRAIAENHEVPVYAVALLKPGSIPKTSSGKLQRRACRGAFVRGEFNPIGE
jgi:acyl-CoA synthetase (AMP-forming)/AMP-acid ligase II